MAISAAHVGRSYPATVPFLVSEAKIAEFATAIGDDNPAYVGAEAIAPPTFIAVVSSQAWGPMFADPELGLALRRIVHGEQRFDFHRPVRVGDRLSAVLRIERVRNRGSVVRMSTAAEIVDQSGEPVCTAVATLFHSRPSDKDAVADTDAVADAKTEEDQ